MPETIGPRSEGERLSDIEKSIIVGAIACGAHKVAMVNLQLAEHGFKPITRKTFWKIRKYPEVMQSIAEYREIILDEVFWIYLEQVQAAGEVAAAAYRELMPDGPGGGLNFNNSNYRLKSSLANTYFKAVDALRDCVKLSGTGTRYPNDARSELVTEDLVDSMELSQDTRMRIKLAVQEAFNEMLRDLIEKENDPDV